MEERRIEKEQEAGECCGPQRRGPEEVSASAERETGLPASFQYEQIKITGQEAVSMLRYLRRIFGIVRLVDVMALCILELDAQGRLIRTDQRCSMVWNRAGRCEECISIKAYTDKKQMIKLEFINSDIYQVISQYLEIDGYPCVLELVYEIQNKLLLGTCGKSDFVDKITSYEQKLYIDALTGAYNRGYFEDQIRSTSLTPIQGVAVIDVDDFKMINDIYGHMAGDAALHHITRRIQSCIRKSDILIRYGGDEFLLLFPQIPEEVFGRKLERICREIWEARLPNYPELTDLSISIGGVYGISSLDLAIEQADRLMYEAKKQKNTVLCEVRREAEKTGDGEKI